MQESITCFKVVVFGGFLGFFSVKGLIKILIAAKNYRIRGGQSKQTWLKTIWQKVILFAISCG